MFATPSIVGSIILRNFMPLTPSISGNTLLCVRYPLFLFFFSYSFMKKRHFVSLTPSTVGSIILKNFMPLTPSIVGTLCYVRGTPFFLFFFLSFYEKTDFSAIKRVVKNEKMAIYAGYRVTGINCPFFMFYHTFYFFFLIYLLLIQKEPDRGAQPQTMPKGRQKTTTQSKKKNKSKIRSKKSRKKITR